MKIVYGIKNCNTVKKVLDFLNENKVTYVFHDYKKLGIDSETLSQWCKQVSWQILVNKKGTTWRQLSEGAKQDIVDEASAIALMMEMNSVIKRPVISEKDTILAIGYDEVALAQLL